MKILLALSSTVLAFVVSFCLAWLGTKGAAGQITMLTILFVLVFIGMYCCIVK